jgi:outer membrane protein TolC
MIDRRVVCAGFVLVSLSIGRVTSAAGGPTDPGAVSRRPVVLAQLVTLNEALRTFREHGFDALLADAAAMHAEGDVEAASHVANPNVQLFGGRTFNIQPTSPPWSWGVGLTDNGAIFDLLTGKRSLRASSARAALDAAREHRASVELGLEVNVKQSYVQVGLGRLQVEFTEQQTQSLDKTLGLAKLRYPQIIDESDLARVEVQKLEADQALTRAKQGLRVAEAQLALLVGVRGAVPDFDVDRGALGYRIPPALASATEASLFALARQHRPEIVEWKSNVVHTDEALSLERRRVFPDVTLGGFVTGGSSLSEDKMAGGSVAFNVPILYQQQGEIRRAEADFASAQILARRADAQIAADVALAFAAMTTARAQVDRMLGGELDAATRQRDILQKKFDAGQADLNDFLDAQRTYLNVQLEYLQFVAAYWNAVFALERATGTDLR